MHHRVRSIAWMLVPAGVAAIALRCNIWNDGDSSLPIIGQGRFDVTPCAHVFNVVTSAIDSGAAGPEFTFLITGLSQDMLGAESVPVTVSISRCSDCEADGGPGGAQDDGAGVASTLSSEEDAGSTCLGMTHYQHPNRYGAIQIDATGDGGCTSLSSSTARCVLAADGTATFAVRAVLPMVSTEGFAIPVCVCADPKHQREIPIQIAAALDGGRLNVTAGDQGMIPAVSSITVSSCSSLTGTTASPSCQSVLRKLAVSFQVVDDTDAATVTQQPLTANVTIAPPVGAFLSNAADCPPSGPSQLEVDLPSGASTSPPLLFCTFGQSGTYQVTATSLTDPGVAPGSATITADPQPGSIRLTQGGTVGPSATLLDCAGHPMGQQALSVATLDGGALTDGATTDEAGHVSLTLPNGSAPASVLVQVLSTGQTCTGSFQ